MGDAPPKTAPKTALAVAVARNNVIGAGGGLAWKISDDLKWFKSVTLGKPIIMGRKTFQSIGKALPGRDNIVVTRASEFSAEDIYIARSLDGAITLGRYCAGAAGVDEVCIIGGGEIYAQTTDRADRIYLTRVDAEIDGDAFFPSIDSQDWNEKRASSAEKNTRNEYACEFFILDRKPRIRSKHR